MKAILVVDVDNINDYIVEVVKKRNKSFLPRTIYKGELKPMPQKENEFDKCLNDYDRGWRIGYNHCIDEILGEYDEDTKSSSKSNAD